jgi:hypothetical protein
MLASNLFVRQSRVGAGTAMFVAVFLWCAPRTALAASAQATAPSSPAAETPSTPADGQPAASGSLAADGIVTPERQFALIRSAVSQPRLANLNDDQLRFYVHVTAKQPRFSDYVKGYDFLNGPTKGGNPMSHAEFLSMITPKELHSSAGITPLETVQGAIVNWLGQKLIKTALDAIKNARSDSEIQQIQDQIDRELAALNASAK